MPTYCYKSLETGLIYEIEQKMNDSALTKHPQSKQRIERIATAPALKINGLKKGVSVNKLSAAASACGCASNAALAKAMYHNSTHSPSYNQHHSKKTVISATKLKKSCTHAHHH